MRRLLIIAALALAFPGAAWAHATLLQTKPGVRARVEQAPRAVVLNFDQRVDALPNAVEVFDAHGKLVSGPARTLPDTHYVAAPLKRLPKGAYTVRWRTISTDGHVGRGVFTFGVRVAAPPVTEAYGASGPTRTEHVVRWLYFLALALVIGPLGFRLLVLRGPVPPATDRRFYKLAGLGAVGVIEVGIAAFLLRAEDALQLPFTGFLYGDLSPLANSTRFGSAFIAMTLGFAVVSALLFLAWLTERRGLLWPAFALSLGLASGLSLSGHQADDGWWASQLADWVHLSAGTLWLGGLVMLAFVVWPTAKELRRQAFLRFSQTAGGLVALLVGAGVYLSIRRLPALSDLWEAGYGQMLLVKLGLVSLALSWGASHHFVVRPRLDRPGVLGRLPRSLVGESAVGIAILLVAAVLVDSKPPPRLTPQSSQLAQATQVRGEGGSSIPRARAAVRSAPRRQR